MSSYDPVPDEIITPSQFRESMRLVRLQIAIPISVLVAMGANLVCALAIKPGLVGFCLTLLLVRKDETLINGVGLRFAIANWLQAAWAVFFRVRSPPSLSIHITLLYYPVTLKRPIDALFIHAPMTMFLAILFELDWMHNGFIALGWDIQEKHDWGRYTWQAVAVVAAVNVVTALWAGYKRLYLLTTASIYLLFSLLFSSPRVNPTLPTTALPKPTPLLVTLIICLVLHPLALVAGVAWQRTREKEGRIRLEEEVERAEENERAAGEA
ncbi:hypothetical protein IAU60_001936 [Kwoniella sp. DSM 27419]